MNQPCPLNEVWVPLGSDEDRKVAPRLGEAWYYRQYAGNPSYKGRCVPASAIPSDSPFIQSPVSPPFTPSPEPTWAESVPRLRSPILTQYVPSAKKPATTTTTTTKPPPGGGSTQPGGIVADTKDKVLGEVGLLAALTAPAWGTVLLTILLRR